MYMCTYQFTQQNKTPRANMRANTLSSDRILYKTRVSLNLSYHTSYLHNTCSVYTGERERNVVYRVAVHATLGCSSVCLNYTHSSVEYSVRL